MSNNLLIYNGRGSNKLADEVCKILHAPKGDLEIMQHADAEPWYRIADHEKIPGQVVFMIQSTGEFAPRTYFDLWGPLSAIKRYNPKRVIAFIPFMGFRRQERDKEGGEAIMLELMARLTKEAGATDVVLCDPHHPIAIKYFEDCGVKVWLIDPNQMFADVLKDQGIDNFVVLTPDAGRKDAASKFAKLVGAPLVEASKFRPGHDQVVSEGLSSEIDLRDKTVVIREDEISTGGTLINTIKEITPAGFRDVVILSPHGVLVGDSIRQFKKMDEISAIYISDSIYLNWEKRIDKIKVLSIAPAIADIIQQIQAE